MLLESTEMNIELMEWLKEPAERSACGHLGEGIDILREALATIAELAVRARHDSVHLVDVAGEQAAAVHRRPARTHLLAIFAHGIEIGDLVGAEDVVRVLRDFRLQRRHHRKLLSDEDLGQQLNGAGKHHRLLLEVLDMGSFGQELRHVANLMSRLFRKQIRSTGKNGCPNEDRNIRKLADQLLHQRQVLRAVIFGAHVDLYKRNVNVGEVIVHPLRRV